jgi:hypothetical protein
MPYYDITGFYAAQGSEDRFTEVEPPHPPPAGMLWNWTGYTWVLMEPIAPPPPAPKPEWAWYIDHGPFTDRLGAAATVTIDTSTAPGFVAIRADFARRKWIDLEDPRVAATVGYLAGQPLPGLGTLATPLLTAEQAVAVLNTPVTPAENLALRKLYFS